MEYSFDTVLRFVDDTTPKPEGSDEVKEESGEGAV
jgi:hypothetical protein